jgi:hypothetical protein
MSASKAILTVTTLNQKLGEAIGEALKSGLDRSDVAEIVAKLAQILENSDD